MSRRRKHRERQEQNSSHKMGLGIKIIDKIAMIRKEQIEEGRKMMMAENNALKLGAVHE